MILAINNRQPELTQYVVGGLLQLWPKFGELDIKNVTILPTADIDRQAIADGLGKILDLWDVTTVGQWKSGKFVGDQHAVVEVDDNRFVGAMWLAHQQLIDWIITAREVLKVETTIGMVHLVRNAQVWQNNKNLDLGWPEKFLGMIVYRAYQSAGIAPQKDVTGGLYIYDLVKLKKIQDSEFERVKFLKSADYGIWATVLNHFGVRGLMGGGWLGVEAVRDQNCWRWAMQETVDWLTMGGLLIENDMEKQVTKQEMDAMITLTKSVLDLGLSDQASGGRWRDELHKEGFLERWRLVRGKERSAV